MDAEEDNQDFRLFDSAIYSLESVMFLLRSTIAVARTRASSFLTMLTEDVIYRFLPFCENEGHWCIKIGFTTLTHPFIVYTKKVFYFTTYHSITAQNIKH